MMSWILGPLAGYLLGSVPVGYLIGRLWGKDVRSSGSGRTGATNVFRAVGLLPAVLTGLGDLLKGALAILLAQQLGWGAAAEVLAGVASVAGHNWSLFLRFSGGAGTMTNLGALLVLSPLACLGVAPLGLLALALSRYASVASLTVALLVPVGLLLLARGDQIPTTYVWYGLGVAALVVWALRPNIRRLARGEERRLTFNLQSSK